MSYTPKVQAEDPKQVVLTKDIKARSDDFQSDAFRKFYISAVSLKDKLQDFYDGLLKAIATNDLSFSWIQRGELYLVKKCQAIIEKIVTPDNSKAPNKEKLKTLTLEDLQFLNGLAITTKRNNPNSETSKLLEDMFKQLELMFPNIQNLLPEKDLGRENLSIDTVNLEKRLTARTIGAGKYFDISKIREDLESGVNPRGILQIEHVVGTTNRQSSSTKIKDAITCVGILLQNGVEPDESTIKIWKESGDVLHGIYYDLYLQNKLGQDYFHNNEERYFVKSIFDLIERLEKSLNKKLKPTREDRALVQELSKLASDLHKIDKDPEIIKLYYDKFSEPYEDPFSKEDATANDFALAMIRQKVKQLVDLKIGPEPEKRSSYKM